MVKLSETEVELVAKLRDRVKDDVADDFFLRDSNLVRWLRIQSNDMDKAEKSIYKTLQWRKEHKIEDYSIEFFSEVVINSAPCRIQGHDKEGRPVKIANFGDLDAQELTRGNYIDEFVHYIYFTVENVYKTIKQNQNTLGLKECNYFDIVDLDGVTYSKSFTTPFFTQLLGCLKALDTNYPQLGHKHVVINAPVFVDNLFKIVKLALSQSTKKRIFVFGCDETKWKPFLLENVSKDQLWTKYGGDMELDM